jgi:hypothetical protein
MRRLPNVLELIAVALLLWPIQPVCALTFRNSMGAIEHANQISGIVGAVNQNRRSFLLRWTTGGSSYEQTFVLGPATVFKNGSWSNMKKGVRISIEGRSDTVETVEFVKSA